ncbi:MAG: regulatory protein RecX [Victivallales bacterium]|nr:regulatory protein RecX [Victivallales bacterium]
MGKNNNEAIDKAFDLLSRRPHSAMELRDKLYKRKYSKTEIDNAVTECKRLGFLNDELLAADYAAELAGQGKGIHIIRQKLRGKGISGRYIDQVLAQLADREPENAEETLQRKMPILIREPDIGKRRQKAYCFLAYRGFSADIIRNLLDKTSQLH